jgi:ribosomal protein L12E/L44/L45/RPP1/RPP2
MAAPVMGDGAPADDDVHTVVSADTPGNVKPCVSAAAKTLGGADPMAAPVMGDGAPAEGDAPTEDDRDEAKNEVEDFVWGGSEKTPQKNRDSRVHTVVSADTPGNVQPCVSAAAKTLDGADPMAAPVMGDDAPAEGDDQTEDDCDEADDEVEDFVWGG